jgi:hypothetical protein
MELRLRGAYTFVLEVDPDGTCEWPVTKFYWLLMIKVSSYTGGTTLGSIVFPATQDSPSNTWSISAILIQTKLVHASKALGQLGELTK